MQDQNTLRAMCGNRDLKPGLFVVEFATPGIGHILKSAGCRFALLDMEHSGFDFGTIRSTLRYFEAADLATIVRVPSGESHHIARACDIGAEGLMVPMIGTADQARAAVAAMKYHPEGRRGVALQIAHDRFRPGPVGEKLAGANRRTVFVALIETAEGAENAAEIAAVPGVDILWLGHFDLSTSLGIPGEFDNPRYTAAAERIVAAARAAGKSLGGMVNRVDAGVDAYRRGFDFVCYSGDVWLLHDALKSGLDGIRAGIGDAS